LQKNYKPKFNPVQRLYGCKNQNPS